MCNSLIDNGIEIYSYQSEAKQLPIASHGQIISRNLKRQYYTKAIHLALNSRSAANWQRMANRYLFKNDLTLD